MYDDTLNKLDEINAKKKVDTIPKLLVEKCQNTNKEI